MVTNFAKRFQRKKLLKIVRPYTLLDDLRLNNLADLALSVSRVDGDVVECGVCNGGSAAILASTIVNCTDKKLWLFDTFKGIPEATSPDGALALQYTGHFGGDIEKVKCVLNYVNFPIERTVIREGNFQKTFQELLPQKISILHIDADWYESVLCVLESLYSNVSDNGVVILDDFGHWEGARKAFYSFCQKAQIEPLLERAGYTQAYWYKAREHNRQ
jgi:O-methyltransferase